jgi:carbamoyl-phosphate synthase/aspartate carbamoyltransferase
LLWLFTLSSPFLIHFFFFSLSLDSGHNQPCVDVNTQRCHLTSQNHGFAIDSATLPEGWQELFYNANDKTNEGIQHLTRPFFSCQFHPEAKGGPWDTEYLFDYFLAKVTKQKVDLPMARASPPKNENVLKGKLHKVLILGSGGLSIGTSTSHIHKQFSFSF